MSGLRTIQKDGLAYSVAVTLNSRMRGTVRVTSIPIAGAEPVSMLIDEINPTAKRDRDGVVSRVTESAQEEVRALLDRVADGVLAERNAAASEAGDVLEDEQQGQAIVYEEVVPWDEPVDGAALITDLIDDAKRFLILAPAAYLVVALWVLHTHLLDAFAISPVLGITSPCPGCGKTQLLRWLGASVRRAEISANATPSYLFRIIELHRPTILIDEADSYLGENEKIRALVNSGYASDGTFRLTVGDDHEPRAFGTFAAKAIAAIGQLPRTIAERCIPIEMQKKTRSDKVARMRPREFLADRAVMRRRITRWAQDHFEDLLDAKPELPEELTDRQCDLWEPLFAIAECIGKECPKQATAAARVLSKVANEQIEGVDEQLLADIRDLFCLPDGQAVQLADGKERSCVSTAAILGHLNQLTERPWPTWYKGKPIDDRALAKRLKPFRVKSKTLHKYEGTSSDPKGYDLKDLEDAFRRYLRPLPLSAHPPEPLHRNDLRDFAGARTGDGRADIESAKSLLYNASGGRADKRLAAGVPNTDEQYEIEERRALQADGV